MQLAEDANFPWKLEKIIQKAYGQMKKCGIYKDECKEHLNKYEVDQT